MNLPVCTAPNWQVQQRVISDGAGGAIIAWEDYRSGGGYDIYAQHVLVSGIVDPEWPVNGRALCTASGNQTFLQIVSDGLGGCIAVWSDPRSGPLDLYAQHVLANGAVDLRWPTNGLVVCTASGHQEYPQVVSDGAAGAIVAWADNRDLTSYSLYAQHVLASGAVDPSWPANGRAICSTPGLSQQISYLAKDEVGGAVITWGERRDGADYDIYAHHILGSGVMDPTWPVDGRLLSRWNNYQLPAGLISDGVGGAITVWMSFRDGYDIYAHHVLANGVVDPGWPTNGLAVCVAAQHQDQPQITSDDFGGAIIAWRDYRGYVNHDIYAARVLPSGIVDSAWPANGRAICTVTGDRSDPAIVSDDAGGAIIAWGDGRSGNFDIYAQHVFVGGTVDPAWPADGRALCSNSSIQELPQLVTDGMGGAIAVWGDRRYDTADIFAQRVAADGHLGALDRAPTVATPTNEDVTEGLSVGFTVSASDPDGDAITSLTASGTAIVAGASFMPDAGNASGTFSWTPSCGQAGSYAVTFTAANALTGTATASITVAPALVVTDPAGGELWQTGSGSQSHTIAWSWAGPPVDGFWVDLEYSLDGGSTFQRSPILDPYVPGDQREVTIRVPQDGIWPNHFDSPFAKIVVSAGDVGVPRLASATSPTFVVWAKPTNHVLLSAETPIFTLEPIPPCGGWSETDVSGFEVWWERELLSDTRKPPPSPFDGVHNQIPGGSRYFYYPAAAWNVMPPGIYNLHVRALRVGGGPDCEYPLERFVRANLTRVRSGNPPQAPNAALLLHGIWSSCDETFGCELKDALAGEGHDVWTLDYPNIGDIRYSAAAMEQALQVIRNGGGPTAYVIGHSMGGLVSRACIQALGRDPQASGAIPYSDGIAKLVTLGTPHQGAQTKLMWRSLRAAQVQLQYFAAGTTHMIYPEAVKQVDDRDENRIWPALNAGYAQETTRGVSHLFLQGTDPLAAFPLIVGGCEDPEWDLRGLGGIPVEDPNDFAVAAWRAVPPAYDNSDRRRCVQESHATIARLTSAEYESYIGPFLRGEPYLDEGAQRNCTPTQQRPSQTWIERQLFQGGESISAAGRKSWAGRAFLDSTSAAIAGASVSIGPVGSEPAGLWIRRSDTAGQVTAPVLQPGDYVESISARGYISRSIAIHVEANGDGPSVTVSLELDQSFTGPTSPSIRIRDGAPVAQDSTVLLHLECTAATEMIVGEDPNFAIQTWQPFQSTLPYTFEGGPGSKAVFAAFRNLSGVSSDTVSAVVVVQPDSVGSVYVTSNPAGASVTVDGRVRSGLVTPTLVDSLPVGSHTISVSEAGFAGSGEPAIVFVSGGTAASANFELVPATAPTVPTPLSPAGGYVSTRYPLLVWSRAHDPDAGEFLSYRVMLARDGLGASAISDILGVTDTLYAPQVPLPDSSIFWFRVEARDSHGLGSGPSASAGPTAVDVTAPKIAVAFPSEGFSLLLGQSYTIQWSASDWSGIDSLTALLSRDGGQTYAEVLFHGRPNDSAWTWVVGGTTSDDTRLRMIAYDRAGNTGVTETPGGFRISSATGVGSAEVLPRSFALYPGYPNPFNPQLSIRYDVPAPARVVLQIFDVQGRLVKTLADGVRPAGRYSALWTGFGASGERVASGVYLLRLTAGNYHFERKAVLAR